jgi:hypothetical protein
MNMGEKVPELFEVRFQNVKPQISQITQIGKWLAFGQVTISHWEALCLSA